MHCPEAVVFDLDNTLAESFTPPEPAMIERLTRLVPLLPVSIMSAASFERISRDVLAHLPENVDLTRLRLFTANAAQCYEREGEAWSQRYAFGFTAEERDRIYEAIRQALTETGIAEGTSFRGERFIDYAGYVAFTAVGTDATREEKRAWDPDGAKRRLLREAVMRKIPEFDVFMGGATSIDVTPRGINKSYGVTWLARRLAVDPAELLYVGDALYEGGNDVVVIPTGIRTRSVNNPAETLAVIDEIISVCS